VAVNGFDRLLDGAKVTIRQPSKSAGTAAGQQQTGQSQAGQSQASQSQSGQSNGSAPGGKNGAARQ